MSGGLKLNSSGLACMLGFFIRPFRGKLRVILAREPA